MSDYVETAQEQQLRDRSEKANPYAAQCPNRHLWSEGFRMGAAESLAEIERMRKALQILRSKIYNPGEHADDHSTYRFKFYDWCVNEGDEIIQLALGQTKMRQGAEPYKEENERLRMALEELKAIAGDYIKSFPKEEPGIDAQRVLEITNNALHPITNTTQQ